MLDLHEFSRIVCDHQWSNPAEWASALDALAGMSDAEIDRLVAGAATRPASDGSEP